ncbi:MAG: hypothetical protein J6D03_08900 [Clostridia bacterium]|nr:hypothetical protein [Clostridia bacterium]
MSKKNEYMYYKMTKQQTLEYLRNILNTYSDINTLIRRKSKEIELQARADYKNNKYEDYDDIDEFIGDQILTNKELNKLKYQYQIIRVFINELTKGGNKKILVYLRLKYFLRLDKEDIIAQLNLNEEIYNSFDEFLLEKFYKSVLKRGNIYKDWSKENV